MNLAFEWNDLKAEENLRKHGVDFEDAAAVFFDLYRSDVYDALGYDEDRFITVGLEGVIVLVVVYTMADDKTVRLISARKATTHEQKNYWQQRPQNI